MRVAISLGIRMHDGRMAVLIPRNTALPAKVSRMLSSVGKVEILAGEHPLAKDNHRLGWIEIDPQSLHEIGSFRLSFEIEITGSLTATIEETLSGRSVRRAFESFRDVQNVLASMEYGGAWRMLTSLANKLKVSNVPAPLIHFGSEQQATEFSNNSNVESVDWAIHPQRCNETFVVNGEFVIVVLVAFICFFMLYIRRCRKQRNGTKRGDTVHEEQLIARINETDAALTEGQVRYEEQKKLTERLALELKVARLLLDQHREEIQATHDLSSDLLFIVYDETNATASRRYVKIQCPGVRHQDIEIEIVFNGVVVNITRQQSHGMSHLSWTKRFQFQLEEGHFQFQEDEVHLEFGVLYLPFKLYTPRSKVFRLPSTHHYNQSAKLAASAPLRERTITSIPAGKHELSEFQILQKSEVDTPPHMVVSSARCFSALDDQPPLTSEVLKSREEALPFSIEPFSVPTESSHDYNSQSQGSDA